MLKSRTLLAILAVQLLAASAIAAPPPRSFDSSTGTITDQRWQSGLPLGGIGVGKIELMTDGSFGDLTNQSNWDRPYKWAKGAFAVIRVQSDNGQVSKILRLKSDDEYTGVQNVAHTKMQGWFPRAQIDYSDPDLPVTVQLKAFSPLIPHNPKDSSLPVAYMDYTVTNTSAKTVKISIALAWPNLLGWGGRGGMSYDDLSGDSQQPAKVGSLIGLKYTSSKSYIDQQENTIGNDFVAVRQDPGVSVSTCSSWDVADTTPAFWSSFTSSGTLPASTSNNPAQPGGAVSATVTLAPGETRTLHYYVTWAMPHLVTVNDVHTFTGTYDVADATIPDMSNKSNEVRWSTDRGMHTGDNLVLDLGQRYTATSINLNSGQSLSDYPRGLKVEVSDDAKTWSPVAQLTKDQMLQVIANIKLTPMPGRYIRLTNLGDEGLFWSIYGLSIQVTGQAAPISPVKATAYLAHYNSKVNTVDVGHFWQNWWQDSLGITNYADQNKDRLLQETRAWQDPVMKSNVPFWLKLKLINCAFPMVSNTVLTKDGQFSILESPIEMGGALGTMDQRMAAHAYLTAFFPELDRAELEQYATCQQTDGRITHFDGNVHQVLVDGNVNYGITDWPDLSSGWILQAVKLYRWTGDQSFLDRVHPHITKAMDWLQKDGADDNLIPAGGSTYDYETLPRGEFIYSASCYLGALRAASSISSPEVAAAYDTHLADVQKSVMTDLWTGTYFRKWRQPSTGRTVDDSFIANMAGDWLTRISGLPETLDSNILRQSVAQTIARHQKPFFPMPPMQVTPAGLSTTSNSYSLQDEPYLGCEAIYNNYVDDGMETIRRLYFCIWEENKSPWDESLCYDAPNGRKGGLPTYMTSPTTWFVLDALGGTSIDIPAKRLYVSPRLTTGQTELHIPVYFSRFWGWLDYVPANHQLTLRVDKVYPVEAELQKSLYHTDGPAGDTMPDTITIASIAADGNSQPITLPAPFVVKEGAVLDLSEQIGALAIPAHSDVVNFEVKAKLNRPGLPSDNWKLIDNLHDDPEVGAIIGQDALDGNPTTRWTTGRTMKPGDQVTLDMAASQTVNKLVIDITKSPTDYPRGYKLESSTDGETWTQIASATEDQTVAQDQAGLLTIPFPALTARYLRITNEGSDGPWWSIGEISAYAP